MGNQSALDRELSGCAGPGRAFPSPADAPNSSPENLRPGYPPVMGGIRSHICLLTGAGKIWKAVWRLHATTDQITPGKFPHGWMMGWRGYRSDMLLMHIHAICTLFLLGMSGFPNLRGDFPMHLLASLCAGNPLPPPTVMAEEKCQEYSSYFCFRELGLALLME
jgi:hypothetical protein